METKTLRPVLQPLKIGSRTLPRRVFLPAHSYNFPCDAQGSPDLVAYLERRLRGGVPMAIVGEAEVPTPWQNSVGLAPGRTAGAPSSMLYEQLAQLAGEHGALILEQLHHPGGQVWFEEQRPAFGPSSYPQPRSYTVPTALSDDEIRALRGSFLAAARTVWRSGLGGVELKADQGKLFHQFLSREFNQRSDGYGGSLKGRLRFLFETLTELRAAAPAEFILGVRLSGRVTPASPASDGGMGRDIGVEESIEICKILEQNNLVDYVSISGETNSTVWGYRQNHGDENVPEATFIHISKMIKSSIQLPVLLAGRILDLDQADAAISSGGCDAVGMARALIADAELLSVAMGLSTKPIRSCLSCNISCVGRTWYGEHVACVYDPLSGREREIARKVTQPRRLRIAVVGAGPAGLEFARVAAGLGSAVTVFERGHEIGGALNIWKQLPTRSRLQLAIDFWRDSLAREPKVKIEFGVAIGADTRFDDFDHVVLAWGARETLPVFVVNADRINLTAAEALSRNDWCGATVVVVDGDRFLDPLAVALFIAMRGAKVFIVTPFDMVGVGLDPVSRASRMVELAKYEISYATWSDIRFSDVDSVPLLYDHCRNSTTRLEQTDTVVWCTNALPERPGFDNHEGFTIGDAVWPRGFELTTREAFNLAYELHAGPEIPR